MGRIQDAASKGQTREVIALLDAAVDVNDPGDADRYGTPLHHAAYGGHAELAQALISRGASVNALDHLGNTPLALASQQGHMHVVRLLLEVRPETP